MPACSSLLNTESPATNLLSRYFLIVEEIWGQHFTAMFSSLISLTIRDILQWSAFFDPCCGFEHFHTGSDSDLTFQYISDPGSMIRNYKRQNYADPIRSWPINKHCLQHYVKNSVPGTCTGMPEILNVAKTVLDPEPYWIRIQELCGSGSVIRIRIRTHTCKKKIG